MRDFSQDNRKLIGIGAATLGGAAIGAAASYLGGQSANAASAYEAKLNRQFQERMTKNKHQYEVADLRKAGLNPILSAHGGAAVPSGATAQQKNPVPENFATTAMRLAQELKNLKAVENKTNTETANVVQNMVIAEPAAMLARTVTDGAKTIKKHVIDVTSAESLKREQSNRRANKLHAERRKQIHKKIQTRRTKRYIPKNRRLNPQRRFRAPSFPIYE